MAVNQVTKDAQAVQDALIALEDEYNIPRDNPLHTLLLDLRGKYGSQLGIDPGYAVGGGTNKS